MIFSDGMNFSFSRVGSHEGDKAKTDRRRLPTVWRAQHFFGLRQQAFPQEPILISKIKAALQEWLLLDRSVSRNSAIEQTVQLHPP